MEDRFMYDGAHRRAAIKGGDTITSAVLDGRETCFAAYAGIELSGPERSLVDAV